MKKIILISLIALLTIPCAMAKPSNGHGKAHYKQPPKIIKPHHPPKHHYRPHHRPIHAPYYRVRYSCNCPYGHCIHGNHFDTFWRISPAFSIRVSI